MYAKMYGTTAIVYTHYTSAGQFIKHECSPADLSKHTWTEITDAEFKQVVDAHNNQF